jgi:multidrug efflux system outer membrane protein
MRNIGIGLLLFLCGCSMAPDYIKPDLDLPASWGTEDSNSSPALSHETLLSLAWWKQFKDPKLSDLLEEALNSNLDLSLAAAKVQQLRAQYNSSESGRAPTIALDGRGNRISNSSESLLSGFPLSDKPYNDFNLSSVFSYEVDLFGRVTNKIDAAKAQLLSVLANRDAIRLSLLSDLASAYFNLVSLDHQISISTKTLETRKESLQYQEKQHRLGALDQVALYQAQAEEQLTQKNLAELTQSRVVQINTISILLGRTPKELIDHSIDRSAPDYSMPVSPALPADLPSTLLERRPDIYKAEQELIASNALIGVARADYFPTLSLSAVFGLGSSNLDRLLQSSAKTWQLQSGLKGPIFDLSKSAKADEALSIKDQSLILYKDSVVKAFKEVIDAKSNQRTTDLRVMALEKQVAALKNAAEILRKRYRAGYSTNLEKLEAERSLYTAEIMLASAHKDRLIAVVTLAKALGGGWTKDHLDAEPTSICDESK